MHDARTHRSERTYTGHVKVTVTVPVEATYIQTDEDGVANFENAQISSPVSYEQIGREVCEELDGMLQEGPTPELS